ncbi:MAG: hypothetical protein ACI841_004711 [Planctomycetota bacterium]
MNAIVPIEPVPAAFYAEDENVTAGLLAYADVLKKNPDNDNSGPP